MFQSVGISVRFLIFFRRDCRRALFLVKTGPSPSAFQSAAPSGMRLQSEPAFETPGAVGLALLLCKAVDSAAVAAGEELGRLLLSARAEDGEKVRLRTQPTGHHL